MIGWGIIGVGDVTQVKANAVIFNTPESRLLHVMRRTGRSAREYAERHGVPRWSDDAGAVLDDPQVDVVFIATPTASHAELTGAALRAGKHVLCEKPLAMDAEQGAELVALAEQTGRRLWVAYYRRALPRYRQLAELLSTGTIGDLLGVQMSWRKPDLLTGWRWDPARNRGGEFAETVCHGFDLLDHLLGPADLAQGVVSEGPRQVAASWRQAGLPASGSWYFGAGQQQDRLELIGTTGTLGCGLFDGSNQIEIIRACRTEQLVIPDPPHVHGPLVASIVAELHGRGTCPSTGESALRTARVIDAILG